MAQFCQRNYAAAERYGSDRYIQHSAPDRNGLFNPDPHAARHAENQLIVAEGDYVIAHGRFPG